MSFDDQVKPRVNASILPNYVGKKVSLLGIAKDVDSSGNFFTLTTCDEKTVKIMLQEPLSQPVSGLTEVYGNAQSPNTVMCDNFIVISEEVAAGFDMSLYQKAIEYTQRCDSLYIQGGMFED